MSDFPLVTPLEERETDSVPGAFYVCKNVCITCGLPPEIAPANISWDEKSKQSVGTNCPHHCRVEKQPETEAELVLMIEAASGSCVQAIRYCGTDPQIIERFRK